MSFFELHILFSTDKTKFINEISKMNKQEQKAFFDEHIKRLRNYVNYIDSITIKLSKEGFNKAIFGQ